MLPPALCGTHVIITICCCARQWQRVAMPDVVAGIWAAIPAPTAPSLRLFDCWDAGWSRA